MMFRNKVVIVTGSGNGIGKCVAETYALKGASVVIAERDREAGERTLIGIRKNGGTALFVETDVRNPEEIVRLMKMAYDSFGGIDILINNAGVSFWKSPYDITVEEWEDVMAANLRGTFLCAREAARYMRQNEKGGSIVNIASTRAIMSEPNSEAYAATKGGILSLTHALAVSLGPDRIRVNAISPGWIETKNETPLREIDHRQHPAGRVGRPEDIARACLYLTDPANDFVTGTHLIVDGGMTRKMIYAE